MIYRRVLFGATGLLSSARCYLGWLHSKRPACSRRASSSSWLAVTTAAMRASGTGRQISSRATAAHYRHAVLASVRCSIADAADTRSVGRDPAPWIRCGEAEGPGRIVAPVVVRLVARRRPPGGISRGIDWSGQRR